MTVWLILIAVLTVTICLRRACKGHFSGLKPQGLLHQILASSTLRHEFESPPEDLHSAKTVANNTNYPCVSVMSMERPTPLPKHKVPATTYTQTTSSNHSKDNVAGVASADSQKAYTINDMVMPPPPRPQPLPRSVHSSSSSQTGPKPPQATARLRALASVGSSASQPPPSSTSSLRLPPTRSTVQGRTFAITSTSSGLLSPSATRSLPTNKSRQKVLLAPGHSPLDWAALTKSGKNLAGVPRTIKVTSAHLAAANGRRGAPAWSVWQGKVYNITPYLPFHPGGVGELMRGAGKNAEKMFLEAHPWVNWENMLGECLVGYLTAGDEQESTLEEMD